MISTKQLNENQRKEEQDAWTILPEAINMLTTEQRRELKAKLEQNWQGLSMPRNLVFNYQTQEWI